MKFLITFNYMCLENKTFSFEKWKNKFWENNFAKRILKNCLIMYHKLKIDDRRINNKNLRLNRDNLFICIVSLVTRLSLN